MKIKGLDPKPYKTLFVNFMDSEVEFRAEPVTDLEDFEKTFPQPTIPKKTLASGEVIPIPNDKKYRKEFNTWAEARTVWLIAKSLLATEGLEWDQIKFDDYLTLTFDTLTGEFKSVGYPEAIGVQLSNLGMDANALSDSIVKESRGTFLPGAEPRDPVNSSRRSEPPSTPNGEPASASD